MQALPSWFRFRLQTPSKEFEIQELQTLCYEHPFETAFPDVSKPSVGATNTNGTSNGNGHIPNSPLNGVEILSVLKMFDYRYSRFVMNPKTGTFNMIRYGYLSSLGGTLSLSPNHLKRLEGSVLENLCTCTEGPGQRHPRSTKSTLW